MKKPLCLGAAAVMLILCGCEETPRMPPSDIMPKVTTQARTSSTYTGTTVEYVPSTTAGRRNNSFDMPEMPEFPSEIFAGGDIRGADDPFGSEFYALFAGGGASYPDYSVAPEDEAMEQLSATETSAPPAEYSGISVSREDVPEEDMTDIGGSFASVQTARVENPFGDFEMPEYTFSAVPPAVTEPVQTAEPVTAGTMPAAETFDIRELMPDAAEFPDFGDIEFDTAPFGVR